MARTRIKICGVTRENDATRAVELGATFVGLNFWPGSPRCVTEEVAFSIVERIRGRANVVGVFVNQPSALVQEITHRVGLDLVQFHGDEGPEQLDLFGADAIKVFRVGSSFDPGVLGDYPNVWGFLFDCDHPSLVGGTGVPWSYETVADLGHDKPIIVAGGLRPANVAQAIARSRADIVDVSSGVEKRPGVKDAELMARFIREVQHAEEE